MLTPPRASSRPSTPTSARSRRAATGRPAASSVSPSATTYCGSGRRSTTPLQATDRAGEVAARGLDLRQPDLGRRMVRQHEQRLAVRDRGRAERAARELEVAEQRLHVGGVLGRPAAGARRPAPSRRPLRAGRRAARGSRRRARTPRGRGWRSTISCSARPAGAVAAELDERVDEDAVRLGDVGRGAARGERVAQARRGSRGARASSEARSVSAPGSPGAQRGARGAGPRPARSVVRRVAGLADLLRVRVREQRLAVGAARVRRARSPGGRGCAGRSWRAGMARRARRAARRRPRPGRRRRHRGPCP